jgi:hypothetical protein
MHKVIVERPREHRGWRRRHGTKFPRKALRSANPFRELDDSTRDLLAKRRYSEDPKFLNENLQPLVRYLGRQVGRPWNKVFSEISEHLCVRSAVQKHVFDHLMQHVALAAEERDGCVYALLPGGGYGALTIPRWRSYPLFYVCARTGLLKAVSLREPRPNPDVRQISNTVYLVRRHRRWFRVSTKALPDDPTSWCNCFDAYVGAFCGTNDFERRVRDEKIPWPRSSYAVDVEELDEAKKRMAMRNRDVQFL